MNLPDKDDYIDIHTHETRPARGIFVIRDLMAHEDTIPENIPGVSYTVGIHPWYLNDINAENQMQFIHDFAEDPFVVAIGEAGFDRLKGPSPNLQRKIFDEQVIIAEEVQKPVIIHCVRAWEELLSAHKRLKPKIPWLVHGFRGKKELALQLLSHGMYLSFWFDFVLRPESTELLKSLPKDRIFLETDGADIDITDIYKKVAVDLNLSVEELKTIILSNFNVLFKRLGSHSYFKRGSKHERLY